MLHKKHQWVDYFFKNCITLKIGSGFCTFSRLWEISTFKLGSKPQTCSRLEILRNFTLVYCRRGNCMKVGFDIFFHRGTWLMMFPDFDAQFSTNVWNWSIDISHYPGPEIFWVLYELLQPTKRWTKPDLDLHQLLTVQHRKFSANKATDPYKAFSSWMAWKKETITRTVTFMARGSHNLLLIPGIIFWNKQICYWNKTGQSSLSSESFSSAHWRGRHYQLTHHLWHYSGIAMLLVLPRSWGLVSKHVTSTIKTWNAERQEPSVLVLLETGLALSVWIKLLFSHATAFLVERCPQLSIYIWLWSSNGSSTETYVNLAGWCFLVVRG